MSVVGAFCERPRATDGRPYGFAGSPAMSRRAHASLRREVAAQPTEGAACTKELSHPYIRRTFLCRAGSSTRFAGAPSRREPILASPCFAVTMPRPLGEVAPKATERAIAPQAHIICRLGGNIMAKPHHCATGAHHLPKATSSPPRVILSGGRPRSRHARRVAALRFDFATLRLG